MEVKYVVKKVRKRIPIMVRLDPDVNDALDQALKDLADKGIRVSKNELIDQALDHALADSKFTLRVEVEEE